jgi:hypothetical protein
MSKIDQWNEAVESLSGNHSFLVFLDGIKAMKEEAVNELTIPDVISDDRKTLAIIGEIKFARRIVELFEDYVKNDIVD